MAQIGEGRTREQDFNIQHSEAFCLMQYREEKHRPAEGWLRTELLWNSRDGVTPFVVGAADKAKGVCLKHIDWEKDLAIPFFIPPVGMRIFCDDLRKPEQPRIVTMNQWAQDKMYACLQSVLKEPRKAMTLESIRQLETNYREIFKETK